VALVIWGRNAHNQAECLVKISIREMGMFTTKLNFVVPVLGVIIASIQPAFAVSPAVPAPIIGAGLPVLAALAGGYWLIRRLRARR
jgi:lipopolysaccharide export LptBFGC system permease protein LptF